MRDGRRHANLLVVHAIPRSVLCAAVILATKRFWSKSLYLEQLSLELEGPLRDVLPSQGRLLWHHTSVTSDAKEPTHLSCGSPAFAQCERVYRL